jgi:ketosteroid isomerase-like protein
MKRFILLGAAIFGIASNSIARADIPREALSALVPVNTVKAAVKNDNAATITTLYTNDAVVVDEQAPFEWTGAGAGARWLEASRDWSKWSAKIAHLRASLADVQLDSSSGNAYVVMDGVFSSANPKKPWQQRGTLTFTLRKTDGSWKISSQVWAPSVR